MIWLVGGCGFFEPEVRDVVVIAVGPSLPTSGWINPISHFPAMGH